MTETLTPAAQAQESGLATGSGTTEPLSGPGRNPETPKDHPHG